MESDPRTPQPVIEVLPDPRHGPSQLIVCNWLSISWVTRSAELCKTMQRIPTPSDASRSLSPAIPLMRSWRLRSLQVPGTLTSINTGRQTFRIFVVPPLNLDGWHIGIKGPGFASPTSRFPLSSSMSSSGDDNRDATLIFLGICT